MSWIYYQLTPPKQWQAGSVGDKPFYFDCADCGAKEPPIAGILASVPEGPVPRQVGYDQVGILTDGPRGPRNAMFCQPCFEKRIKT